ncbi:MAG: EpsG family protein, partial [Synergistaceae bacterium]|nr:EpsG family protein [Synergistaceae bacterium]
MGDSSIQPELYESGPSKFEWALAFIVLIVPFMSFCYIDTKCIIAYEIKFAQAILNFDLKLAYDMQYFKDLQLALSNWDLPLNFTFGIWGIPLYLWSCRSGELVINFHESFWQILYGKSILLIAFIFSAVLVYKICRAININPQKSRWGAYIYFTSSMSINVISIIGQSDIICVCLTLLGVLAYIKNEDKKFLFWFIIGSQFKQYAFFVFVPLLLLREKNLFKIAGKIFLLAAVTIICNIPFMLVPEAAKARAGFTAEMLIKLLTNRMQLFHGSAPVFVVMLGLLCVYCWLHKFSNKSDKDEINHQTIFTAMLAMIILFTSFPTYPYWPIHMIPYLAIMTVSSHIDSRKFLLLES